MEKDIAIFISKIRYPIYLIATLWFIEIVDTYFHLGFTYFGIYPRQMSSLPGIFISPFVHNDWDHLIANSLPLLMLTSLLVLFYRKVAVYTYLLVLIGTGILVWLFARPSYHIGASGVLYGLVSFIFWTGVFKRNIKSIILSLITIILYSGLIPSIFPNVEPHISWESHLFGGIIGLIVAFIFKNVIEENEEEYNTNPWANDQSELKPFLAADTFEKTLHTRYLEYLEAQRKLQEEIDQQSLH